MVIETADFIEMVQRQLETAIEEIEDKECEAEDEEMKEYYRGMQYGVMLAERYVEILGIACGIRVR